MTAAEFEIQLKRLQTQWKSGFGDEKRVLIWNAFQSVSQSAFSEAVSELIGNHRGGAPIINDLERAVNIAKMRENQPRFNRAGGFDTLLAEAAQKDHTTDKEFIRACREHYENFRTGKITNIQFYSGCEEIQKMADVLDPKGRTYRYTENLSGRDRQVKDT